MLEQDVLRGMMFAREGDRWVASLLGPALPAARATRQSLGDHQALALAEAKNSADGRMSAVRRA